MSTSARFPPSFTCHLPVACRLGWDLTPYSPARIALRGDTPAPGFPSIITGLHLSTSAFCLGYECSSSPGKPVLSFLAVLSLPHCAGASLVVVGGRSSYGTRAPPVETCRNQLLFMILPLLPPISSVSVRVLQRKRTANRLCMCVSILYLYLYYMCMCICICVFTIVAVV